MKEKKDFIPSETGGKKRKRYKGGMVQNKTVGGIITDTVLIIIVSFLALICVLPMWHTIMASISDPVLLLANDGFLFVPLGTPTFEGYKLAFDNAGILSGYGNTIYYTIATTLIGFLINVLGGYALSCSTKLKKPMMIFLIITLMFSGGMIPTYMVMNELGLVGTEWAIILPEATMAMYVIVGMNAFNTVPKSTIEAARIDGAGHFKVMFQVMLPQCLSLFVITILYTFVASWNSWLSAQIYVPFDTDKWPLQLWIQKIVDENKNILQSANPNYYRYLIQYAVIVIAVLPMLVAFPFFQKYLEAGTVTGGVKE